jgi:hypothetical protein
MAQQNQGKKGLSLDDIIRSDKLQEIPIGKCVPVGGKEEMMVCRTDENEYVADGNGVQFKGKIKS